MLPPTSAPFYPVWMVGSPGSPGMRSNNGRVREDCLRALIQAQSWQCHSAPPFCPSPGLQFYSRTGRIRLLPLNAKLEYLITKASSSPTIYLIHAPVHPEATQGRESGRGGAREGRGVEGG